MEKIIQIIPAPEKMAAHYDSGKKNEDGITKATRIPIACLALVQCESGDTEVRPMIMTPDGYAEFATEDTDFICTTND